ncbi:MAG: hypothetical protein RBU21_03875 [FCB group bacterium]|nr:hypothetical protein [FCB group bacterium]
MTFPEPSFRELIGDAVHYAASKLFEPSVIHAAPINTIGCFLLQHLMQREFRPVAGSIGVVAGGTPFGLEADLAKIEAHEYYVWIEARHEDGRIEVVDFASRYWRAWAKGVGVLWIGASPPDVVWAWKDEVAADLARYETEPEITERVRYTVSAAVEQRSPEGPVQAWEDAINDAIHFVASSERGLAFLAEAGLAEPVDEAEPG